jgi:hypothetical protein
LSKPNFPVPKKDVGPTRTFGQVQDTKQIVEAKTNDLPPPKMTTTQFGSDKSNIQGGSHLASFGTTSSTNLSGSNTFTGTSSGPFGGNLNQSSSSPQTTTTTQPINKFQPPPMNKPSFPKPNIPTTTTTTSNTNTIVNNPPTNQFTQNQNISSTTTQQNFGPPPTSFNKAGPGGLKTPPPNQKAIPKPNLGGSGSLTTTQTTNQMLTDADLPEHCGLIYETVMRGIEVLDQIDKNPKKRIENEQKMNSLFQILAAGSMKENTFQMVSTLCDELVNGNFDKARALQEKIAKDDWDANKDWLNVMRRIILRK